MNKALIIIFLIICAITEIGLALYLTEWRHIFWDCVVAKEYYQFIYYLGIFLIVALVLCAISGWSVYLLAYLGILYRQDLNSKANIGAHKEVDNINQRIQEDCKEYARLLLDLIFNGGKALGYIIVFSIALAYNFSWVYLLFLVVYSGICTLIARKIAYPLISLNYRIQRAEATYRQFLIPINFEVCIGLMFSIAIREKYLSYFQSFYNQFNVIVPLIFMAPAYFFTSITIGALVQATSTMGTIINELSYGINAFSKINHFLACRRRLKEIDII